MLITVTPAAGEPGHERGIDQRVQHPEHGLAGSQRADDRLVRPADRDDEAGAGHQFVAGHDGGAGLGVRAVGEPGAVTRAGLHEHVKTRSAQPREHLGNERHPAFAGSGLLQDPYLHGHDLIASGEAGCVTAFRSCVRRASAEWSRHAVSVRT